MAVGLIRTVTYGYVFVAILL